jgi:Ser/Thr protein kinase RdoA (MazF antagonist)
VTAADPSSWRSAADTVLTHYALDVTHIAHITQGLVNLTLKVTTSDGRHYALQRLHPVFGAGVNHNIEAVCTHLAARGMLTPQLVRTRDDALAVEHAGGRWRVMTWVEGRAFDFLDTPAQAQRGRRTAGALPCRARRFPPCAAHRARTHPRLRAPSSASRRGAGRGRRPPPRRRGAGGLR